MKLTAEIVRRIVKGNPPAAHVASVVDAVNLYGERYGLDQPHRLAQFLAQLFHESTGLVDFKERWGPTAAQKRYEGRKDLGNTQKGDGSKFRGYGPIQLTGRDNVTRFYKWCVKEGYNVPDFIKTPSLISDPKWAGLSAIWFWSVGNKTGKSLNTPADRGDIENITRVVNGGLNGYTDRLEYYDRTALVFLGYGPTDIKKFQKEEGLEVDGISGPMTRQAFQKELLKLTSKPEQAAKVQTAPVVQKVTKTVEVKEPVPVKVESIEKPWYQSRETVVPLLTGGTITGVSSAVQSVGGIPWQNLAIIVGAVMLAAIGYVIYARQRDRAKQAASVEKIKEST